MYHIKRVRLNEQGVIALFLVSENDRDFLSEWENDRKTKEVGKSLISLLINISVKGYDWAFISGKLKYLDGNLGIIEIKKFSGIWRVICYFRNVNPQVMVILKAIRGHQGTDKIPPDQLDEFRALAKMAKEAIDKEMRL